MLGEFLFLFSFINCEHEGKQSNFIVIDSLEITRWQLLASFWGRLVFFRWL